MFAPGETITHEFYIPFADTEIEKIIFTYKQNDKVVLTKPISSGFEKITEAKTKVTLVLSQKETLLFSDKDPYTVQLNVWTTRGSRATSKELRSDTYTQHYKEVITHG